MMGFDYEPRPETELTHLEKALHDLQRQHHQEWNKLFKELNELKKKLARTCEHDWNTHHHHCRKCGLDYEFYRQKGLWTR